MNQGVGLYEQIKHKGNYSLPKGTSFQEFRITFRKVFFMIRYGKDIPKINYKVWTI